MYVVSPCNASLQQFQLSVFNFMFVMLTGRHTTQHTDKCTDRIIRLCTSVALDGLNLMERQVVSTVSIFLYYYFPIYSPLRQKCT